MIIIGTLTYKSTIDIHLYDTYYILPLTVLTWVPTLILVLSWLAYLATKSYLQSKRLTWTHVILTILISLLIVASPYLSGYSNAGGAGAPRRYYDHGALNRLHIFYNLSDIIVLLAMALFLGQILYFINLGTGIFFRVIRQNNR